MSVSSLAGVLSPPPPVRARAKSARVGACVSACEVIRRKVERHIATDVRFYRRQISVPEGRISFRS